jgi:hypothetical protein
MEGCIGHQLYSSCQQFDLCRLHPEPLVLWFCDDVPVDLQANENEDNCPAFFCQNEYGLVLLDAHTVEELESKYAGEVEDQREAK